MNYLNITYKKIAFIVCMLFFLTACEDPLNIDPSSELAPGNFLSTQEGINSVLFSSYNNIQFSSFSGANKVYSSDWSGGYLWETGGGLNRTATLYMDFTWDASQGWLNGFWNTSYQAIRDANVVIDNVDNAEIVEAQKNMIVAEARFVRATAYFYLYNWFGPTPLVITSDSDNLEPTRASDEEMKSFLEEEYEAVISILPEQRPYAENGRATKGAALGMLTKFYLNTKQWQKSADVAQEIMEMGIYDLFPDYFELFNVANENNNEFIFVHPATAQAGEGNVFPPAAFPPDYPTPGSHENWAAQVRLRDSFVNSFESGDERLDLIVTEFTDVNGNQVQLLGNDNSRSFKYWPDPNANGRWTGNDIPEIRYADILLSRAEALNELNGPNQESIDLINEVRDRAGISLLQLSDFSTKEELRSQILQEREWEFFHEGKRRQDEIRQGVYISTAQDLGKNAQSHHILYPIPQSEMDANPNLEQNPGY